MLSVSVPGEEPEGIVSISGLVIRNGNNGDKLGGGVNIAAGHVTMDQVDILNNQAKQGAGLLVTGAGMVVSMTNCSLRDNTASSNGANYIYNGAQVSMDNCIIRGNKAAMGNAFMVFNSNVNNGLSTVLTLSNSEISGNEGGRGTIYLRGDAASNGNAKLQAANCTFWGNTSSNGGSAIAVYGKDGHTATDKLYICTITDNTCTGGGGALRRSNNTYVWMYNTIVSGNTYASDPSKADLVGTYHKFHSITGATTFGEEDQVAVEDAPEFVASSMLTQKTQEGKTTVFALSGSDNPAKTNGYSVAGLQRLDASFDDADALLAKDQWGNARPDYMMGAYTGN